MRIALITPGFSADEQDWCIPALLHLVRRLAREHEIEVFPLRYPPRRATYRVAGALVHPLEGGDAAGVGRLPLLLRGLRAVLSRGRFDVVHGLWADEPGFLAVLAARLTGAPALVSLMGGEIVDLPELGYGGWRSRLNRMLTALALRRAARVTCGSAHLARLAAPRVPAGRLVTMPLGVDTALFSPGDGPARRDGPPAILHVGGLVPVKDQAMLLRAMARLTREEPGARLEIVGEGPLQGELERLARELGVAESVSFQGGVAHHELPARYRAADLLALTSRFESQGMVLLEAAACGLPAAGSAVGILPEIAPGRAVPPGDDGALAAAMLGLLRDRARLREEGLAARRLVEERYSLERSAGALVALYRGLA